MNTDFFRYLKISDVHIGPLILIEGYNYKTNNKLPNYINCINFNYASLIELGYIDEF